MGARRINAKKKMKRRRHAANRKAEASVKAKETSRNTKPAAQPGRES